MNIKFYDVIVAKEFQVIENGKPQKRTKWRQVGSAWASKSGNALNLELFMFPGERYLVKLQDKQENQPVEAEVNDFDNVPF